MLPALLRVIELADHVKQRTVGSLGRERRVVGGSLGEVFAQRRQRGKTLDNAVLVAGVVVVAQTWRNVARSSCQGTCNASHALGQGTGTHAKQVPHHASALHCVVAGF